MSLNFHRNYFGRRGFHPARRTEAEWYGTNIGSGWIHNFNVNIATSEDTEAQGQPSAMIVYDEVGAADEYEFDQRVGAWNVDIYRPVDEMINTQEAANFIFRDTTNEDFELYAPSGLILGFSAVDAN